MNARTVASIAVVALAVIALALGAVIVLRDGTGAGPKMPPAEEPTCDVSVMPRPLFPAVDVTPVLLWPESGARLTFDGVSELSTLEAPLSFPPGDHAVHLQCGALSQEQTLTLEPYRAAAVFADCKGGPTLVLFGVGDDEKAARVKASKGPRGSGLRSLVEALGELDRKEGVRLNALFIQRWNGVTERYGRVRAVVGREAAGASDSANTRFEELSKGFSIANEARDARALDASIRAAEETLRVLIRAARLSRPHDCEFQARLTQSF